MAERVDEDVAMADGTVKKARRHRADLAGFSIEVVGAGGGGAGDRSPFERLAAEFFAWRRRAGRASVREKGLTRKTRGGSIAAGAAAPGREQEVSA